jgi:hypothetical protein
MDGKSTHGVHLQNMPSPQETVETLWLDCRNTPHALIPRMAQKMPEVEWKLYKVSHIEAIWHYLNRISRFEIWQ